MRTSLVFCVLATSIAFTAPAFAEAETPLHTIAVAGAAESLVPADFAVVSLGVMSQGATVASTAAENNTRMARVIDAIRKLGVADADIQTVRFDIAPRYASRRQGDEYQDDVLRPVVGYAVTNYLEIKLRDMTKISQVIDRSIEAGANSATGVDFSVENVAELFDRVRKAAIANALHKAEVIATATHLKLGRAVSVTDNEANRTYDNRARGYANYEVVVVTGSRLPYTPIMPGQVRVVSTVTVLYQVN